MALVTVRVDKLIVTVGVAGLACHRRVSAGQRKFRRAVIKARWLPGRRCVARFASMVEESRHVIGVRRLVEIGLVTREAGTGQAGKLVVQVTIRTKNRTMGSRKGEFCIVVREGGRSPGC